MNKKYEIAIIGTGPAGLEAAITAKIRNKDIIVIGSKQGTQKVSKGHQFLNYLGLPDIEGADLNNKFLAHAKSMGINIIENKVNAIYSSSNSFSIQAGNDIYEAKTVILATGITFARPYTNEERLLGHGVSYCATCDGVFYKGKNIAVICNNKSDESEVKFLETLVSSIYYFPMYKDITSFSDKVKIINEIPKEIVGEESVSKIITNEHEYDVDGVFILRDAISPKNLVPGLITDAEHVIVDKHMATNIKGLFACGDVVGKPYQAIKAAGEGNVAALSAVEYLYNLSKNTQE